ncbi:MAG TPA: BCAM0308 family protein [Candidatus Binatia bacterium]
MSKKKGGPVRIRRNIHRFGDPYLPSIDPGETAYCTECHALFHRRRWFFDEEQYLDIKDRPEVHRVACPACRKIKDRYFEGQLTLAQSPFFDSHKEEIINLIRNEEERAKGINPLERIISISEEHGKMVVTTTNEKLAQRIGRELKKAYQGRTEFHWSKDDKCLRVTWAREA